MTNAPAIVLSTQIDTVRSLGRRGVPVTLVSAQPGPTGSSRYVSRKATGGAAWSDDFDGWLPPLLAGKPNTVVIPATDEPAWHLARYRGLSQAKGRLAIAGFDAVRTILAKHQCYTAARDLDVPVPRWWLATDRDAVQEAAATAQFPVVLKPQSRIGIQHWLRGRLARTPEELAAAFDWYREHVHFDESVLRDAPGMDAPLIQEYTESRPRQVYHLAGYLASTGDSVVAAHVKLLQYPTRFGNGACFAAAEVDGDLAGRVLGFLRGIGYHGIFEGEFVGPAGGRQLIDMNPRPYNGITLEIARGLDPVWWSYLEASGEFDTVAREMDAARGGPSDLRPVWRNKTLFWTILGGQVLTGGLSPREAAGWVRWARRHRRHTVDPYFAPDDRAPGHAYLRWHLASMVTQPRAFLGNYVLHGAGN